MAKKKKLFSTLAAVAVGTIASAGLFLNAHDAFAGDGHEHADEGCSGDQGCSGEDGDDSGDHNCSGEGDGGDHSCSGGEH